MKNDMPATASADAVLRALVKGIEAETGEAFFQSLVQHFASVLGVAYAFVSELDRERSVFRTIAVWGRDRLLDNFEIPLAGTPCEAVLAGEMAHHAEGVQQRFPADAGIRRWGVESYAGVPMISASGEVLGHLAVFDERPMPDGARTLSVLRIFAARARAEVLRLRAEVRLRESEARYRDLYEEAPVAYASVDRNAVIQVANRAITELFGYSREESVGHSVFEFLADTPSGIERSRAFLERFLAGEEIVGEELECRHADGRPLWVQISARPQRDAAGAVVSARVTLVDITDRKRAEQAIAESQYLQEEIKSVHNFEEIVGRSRAFVEALERVRLVADTDSTVLVLGETGTGKELIVRAIHSQSRRSEKPLIKVNCAAMPTGLIESELFGHERGAFTGATERRVGRFQLADGGTLFLDEIGEMPVEVQSKLLRVLQERQFERVGGRETIEVDVRVIAATSRDLARAVEEGGFRPDLYYRLNVFPLTVPALRQRPEDVSLLVHYFIGRHAPRIGRKITAVTAGAMERLTRYAWPGNVRELENVVERAIILSPGPLLEIPEEIVPPVSPGTNPAAAAPRSSLPSGAPDEPSPASLLEVEREHIITVLRRTGWRLEGPQGAAKILGVNPSTLRSRMRKLGIERSREASGGTSPA